VRRWLLVLAAALALSAPASAATPHVDARAWLVENGSTGEVVLSHDANEQVPIASITKLMTVLLTLEHTKLSDVVTVAPQAAAVGESSAGLIAGEQITVHDLLEAALIQSANDAADALAYYVGDGSITRFVGMMNARARSLGLDGTHYVRPDGLDAPGHVSTAHDMTKLARILMEKPVFRDIVRRRSAVISGGRVMHTWNDLLGVVPGVIGVKTGHTSAAGWCQVVAVRGRGLTLYVTILGSPSEAQRNADLETLISYGLSQFTVVRVLRQHHAYASAAVGYGLHPVALVVPKGMLHVVRVGHPVVETVSAPRVVSLPVKKGQRLGEIRVYAAGKLLGSRPLVAARSVSRPGLPSRLGFYAGRTVHHLWGFVA
jgi:serine-type D-Ala-D-Ala carboxypeptidase (penicillin-binding protein 5/6)